jgi:hypothetical protein
MHKRVKCLDVKTGRVYISRDVVFDETLFPFANLRPNVGALLRKENFLLPEYLQNHPVSSHEGDQHCTDLTPNDFVITGNISASQVQQQPGENLVQNGEEMRPNGTFTAPHALGARHKANLP